MDSHNPDDFALLLVQQFLHERGYSKALKETEKAHGLSFVEDKLPKGAMLLELVYAHMEREAAGNIDDSAAELRAEEEALIQGGASDYPSRVQHDVTGLHSSNITSICHCPNQDAFITGTSDGTVQKIALDGTEHWRLQLVGLGGVISLSLAPPSRDSNAQLLVGTMDGSVTLIEGGGGSVQHSVKAHAKYVNRVKWGPCGTHLVTASADGSLSLFTTAATGTEAEASQEGVRLRRVSSVPFSTGVQDVEFLPNRRQVVLALRDSNYLRLRKYPEIQAEEGRVNMNALGDDHVSFSARQLAVSPDGKLLLVSTDGPRILLLRIPGWQHLSAQIFGLAVENFHNPVALWHASGYYIMAAAAAGQVYVFHVGTGKVAAVVKVHAKNVRWMDYDGKRNLLFTCSYDRSVKVLSQQVVA